MTPTQVFLLLCAVGAVVNFVLVACSVRIGRYDPLGGGLVLLALVLLWPHFAALG